MSRIKVGGKIYTLSAWQLMALSSVPEQLALKLFDPRYSFTRGLAINAAMFTIHFAWNGFMAKADSFANELPWIVGTAAFSKYVLGSTNQSVLASMAFDAIFTAYMREAAHAVEMDELPQGCLHPKTQ